MVDNLVPCRRQEGKENQNHSRVFIAVVKPRYVSSEKRKNESGQMSGIQYDPKIWLVYLF